MVFPFLMGKEMVIHQLLALKKKNNPSICAQMGMYYILCWCSGNFCDLMLSRAQRKLSYRI